ncbi:hypothetical protein DL98DRAFT_570066 [Cadophora sp. DSE1049]|nr:hypothetical protein DL98DRAFT_570066 [Cadophora sp. DSE1049]
MSTLPTTRTLLTSLFNTLTTTDQISTQQQPAQPPLVNEPYDSPSNPFKTLSPSHRALLSTLHVLFTPPMLLQALDLLDRGLVVRVVEQSSESMDEGQIHTQSRTQAQAQGDERLREVLGGDAAPTGTETETGREVFPPQANIHLPSSPPLLQPDSISQSHQQPPLPTTRDQLRPKPRTTLHQVRSSQPAKSRFRDASSSTSNSSSNIYTVRLEAWNCSCAAFAFASFPASSVYPSKSPWNLDLNLDEDGDGNGEYVSLGGLGGNDDEGGKGDDREGEGKWEFGGMSMDGKGSGGGGVPCCKHLLACVLGERWDILRGYVKEKVVSREEMAGLGCE